MIDLEIADGVGTVWLNRPDKRNALDAALVDALRAAVEQLGADDAVRTIVLAGRGAAFCAGADLAYLQQLSRFSVLENMEDSASLARTLRAIYAAPKPTIARVHGPAIAGGCGLATVCDMALAVEGATFGYTEVRIGFIPAIVSAFLQRKATQAATRELLLSGRIISAREAHERGLITRVLPDEEGLDAALRELVGAIGAASPTAVSLTKQMLTALDGMSLDAALDYTARMNALTRMTPDCQVGIARFLEKSKGR